MTLLGVLSVKGAPGVTTLSCLLAAVWPGVGPVAVVEADPAGGDLAARFGLSSALGRTSLAAAVRRGGASSPVAPHLQHLPGGLDVLVAGGSGDPGDADQGVIGAIDLAWSDGMAVVDLGRVAADARHEDGWLERCHTSVLVVSGDPAAALHARAHAARLLDSTRGRLGIVVVGSGTRDSTEVGAFAGIRALGDIPFDPGAAAVASGASSAGRRLERSGLLAAVRRVASELAVDVAASDPPARSGSVGREDATRPPGRSLPDDRTDTARAEVVVR
jgi:hypothetical protein